MVPPDEAALRADPRVQAQSDLIEDTFSMETSDFEWAHEGEVALQEMFQHEDITAIVLVRVEYHATMCRLEVAVNNGAGGAAIEESLRRLMHISPWPGQGFSRVDNVDGESPTAVLYLARERHFFPQLALQEGTPEGVR